MFEKSRIMITLFGPRRQLLARSVKKEKPKSAHRFPKNVRDLASHLLPPADAEIFFIGTCLGRTAMKTLVCIRGRRKSSVLEHEVLIRGASRRPVHPRDLTPALIGGASFERPNV
jgi:hypothetical protein